METFAKVFGSVLDDCRAYGTPATSRDNKPDGRREGKAMDACDGTWASPARPRSGSYCVRAWSHRGLSTQGDQRAAVRTPSGARTAVAVDEQDGRGGDEDRGVGADDEAHEQREREAVDHGASEQK